jgi:hypothetical protein
VTGDAILISLRQDGQGTERAVTALDHQPYVRELSADDGQVRLYVDDGGEALPQSGVLAARILTARAPL